MIAQDHRILGAQVGDQPLPLAEIDRHALIIMERDICADEHRRLSERQKPLLVSGHSLAGRRVQMHHCVRVLSGHVNGRMDRESSGVRDERGRIDRIAFHVDLHQRRCGHFLEHQLVRIEQEVMIRSWDTRREVREDQVVPTVIGNHAIGGSEILANRPFLLADVVLERRDFDGVQRLGLAHAPIDSVDTVHFACSCRSGCAAAKASILDAFSSARSNVG